MGETEQSMLMGEHFSVVFEMVVEFIDVQCTQLKQPSFQHCCHSNKSMWFCSKLSALHAVRSKQLTKIGDFFFG